MRHAIVVALDDRHLPYFNKQLYYSLRYAQDSLFNGEIHVLYYGKKEDVELKLYEGDKLLFFHIQKLEHLRIENQRFGDIAALIKSTPRLLKQKIIILDGGDTWLQSSIYPLFKKINKHRILYVTEPVNALEGFFKDTIDQLPPGDMKQEMYKLCKKQAGINCGMFAGTGSSLQKICAVMDKLIKDTGMNYFALDQVVFNYLMYKYYAISKEVGRQYNFVLQSNPFVLSDKKVYSDTVKDIILVHNAGSQSRKINQDEFDLSKPRRRC
jgi:hypothetical protein